MDLYEDGGEILETRWGPDGSELLVVQAEAVRLLRVGEAVEEVIRVPPGGEHLLTSGRAGGQWCLLYRQGGEVRYRASLDGEDITLVDLDGANIEACAFAPNGSQIAVAFKGLKVGMWSGATGERLRDFRFDAGPGSDEYSDIFGQPEIRALRWSGDGRYLSVRAGFPIPADGVFLVDVERDQHVATLG